MIDDLRYYGRKLRRALNLRIINASISYQRYEADHLRRLLKYLDIDCVFDVGGNNGQYAQMLRRFAGFRGTILTFEPIPYLVGQLRKKAHFDRDWHIYGYALSNENGYAKFNVAADSVFSSLKTATHEDISRFKSSNRAVKVIDVELRRLDDLFGELAARHGFQRPFLKMDTQGSDLQVFEGAGIHQRDFFGLQSEMSFRRLYEGAPDFALSIETFRKGGFELSAIVPNTGSHFPVLIEADCIMARQDLLPRDKPVP